VARICASQLLCLFLTGTIEQPTAWCTLRRAVPATRGRDCWQGPDRGCRSCYSATCRRYRLVFTAVLAHRRRGTLPGSV